MSYDFEGVHCYLLSKLVQERKEMLAGERKGLTRSGRKVVARYKNGFVASTEQEV